MSELLKINVNEHTEKKGKLTYLSWAWAWAEVLKLDPQATWEAIEFKGLPVAVLADSTCMVKTAVTLKGHTKTCWLPVMNHLNKAIPGPDAMAVNTSIMRCLAKCVAMHGLGLYIYAGEDYPEANPEPEVQGMSPSNLRDWLGVIADAAQDDLEAVVRDGLAAATECKDREAFIAIRAAGKVRQEATA